MYYIYRHIRLDNNMPFYIGRGTCQKKQKYQRAFSKSTRNNLWIKIANKHNYKVEIVFESKDFNLVCEKESYFIKLYGKIYDETGILSNLTDGGETEKGFPCSEERKKNISLSKIGVKMSDETKLKMSIKRKGLKKTQDHKIKIGLSQKGSLNHAAKLVLDTNTGVFFGTLKEAYEAYNFNFHIKGLGRRLNGIYENNTSLIYV